MTKCNRCNREFKPEPGFEYQKTCAPCWKLKVDAEPRRIMKAPEVNSLALTEAALLEACWQLVHDFKPKPSEEQAASLTATLFIAITRRN